MPPKSSNQKREFRSSRFFSDSLDKGHVTVSSSGLIQRSITKTLQSSEGKAIAKRYLDALPQAKK